MPISDNLVLRIKAETGQSIITDNINSVGLSGGSASVTLYNDPTYGNLWRITGGTKSADLTALSLGQFSASGIRETTVAMRFRITNRTSNYSAWSMFGYTSSNGIRIANNGSSSGNLTTGALISGSATGALYPVYTNNSVKTIVIRIIADAVDSADLWEYTVGRVGNAPDLSSTPSINTSWRPITYVGFVAGTETLELLDYVAWTRGLTDAEAADVADNLRSVVYPSTGQIAASGTVVASGGADLSVGVKLAGAGADVVSGTASGSLSTAGQIAASGGDVASGTASINTKINAAGSGSDIASGTAAIIDVEAGNYVSPPLESGPGTLFLSQTVSCTWTPSGRVGSMAGLTPVDFASLTTNAVDGTVTLTGLPSGPGQFDVAVLGATTSDDICFRHYGIAS